MADAVVLTKRSGGDYKIVVTGWTPAPYEKNFPVANYSTNSIGVKLNTPLGEPDVMFKNYPPAAWTIGGVTGFTTIDQVTDAITALPNS